MKPILVHNIKELNALEKNTIAILARLGMKKKIEVIKQAREKGIQLLNVQEIKKK